MAVGSIDSISLQPRMSAPQINDDGDYDIQSFGVTQVTTRSVPMTKSLLSSEDFQGHGGNYQSASYQGSQYTYKDTSDPVFSATEVFSEVFNDNGDLNLDVDAAPDLVLAAGEFIESPSVSISYNKQGLANISFSVISSQSNIFPGLTLSTTFGNKTYKGVTTSYKATPIRDTNSYRHEFQLVAVTT